MLMDQLLTLEAVLIVVLFAWLIFILAIEFAEYVKALAKEVISRISLWFFKRHPVLGAMYTLCNEMRSARKVRARKLAKWTIDRFEQKLRDRQTDQK